MLDQVTKDRFDEIYEIMEKSFPEDEIRPLEEQLELFSNKHYRIYAGERDGRYISFIAVWNFDGFVFIEHFATDPCFRNCGLGKQTLCEIAKAFAKPLVLEVEEPEGDNEKRRIAFYTRNGFFLNRYPYMQPPISKGRKAIPLMIMSSPSPLSRDGFEMIKNTLYREVYKINEKIK